MAFSFNPTQQPQGAVTQPEGQVGFSAAAGSGIQPAGTPTIASFPDSPFLFLHDRDKPMSIPAYIQIGLMILTVLSIIVSGTIFAYSLYLGQVINAKKADLSLKEKSIKTYPFEDMKRISLRYATLGELVKNYVSARSPLKFLEHVVENQVEVKEFTTGFNQKIGRHVMSFTVTTGNYKALIQQLEALNLTEYNKVAPSPKAGDLKDDVNSLEIKISTPLYADGKNVDQIDFTPPAVEKKAESQSIVSSSTPQ
jgi:hypothetical protein